MPRTPHCAPSRAGSRWWWASTSSSAQHDALPADLLKIDEAVQAEQIARLRAVRANRDAVKVADALARIQAAAQDPSAPLMPLFVEAVERLCDAGRNLQYACAGCLGSIGRRDWYQGLGIGYQSPIPVT